MTYVTETNEFTTPMRGRPQMPVAVQVVAAIMFGIFAISALMLAFAVFWPAAIVLALVVFWRRPHRRGGRFGMSERFRPHQTGTPDLRPTGNATFDAYRADVLKRLEDEQEHFEGFLIRLRAAKDQTEFDRFMDQRAHGAHRPD
ncbi:MAG: DUF2852 domain-containing protein [Pseudomonadota bacterium]